MNAAQNLLPVVTSNESAPAFWFLGILWIILIDGEETDGRQSLMEQWMAEGSGPPSHVHPFNDEGFYVIDGEMEMKVGGQSIHAKKGASVWIPKGTPHQFKCVSPICKVLNSFSPAGMEQLVKSVASPAERLQLPPKDLLIDPQKAAAFANNFWGMESVYSVSQTNFRR